MDLFWGGHGFIVHCEPGSKCGGKWKQNELITHDHLMLVYIPERLLGYPTVLENGRNSPGNRLERFSTIFAFSIARPLLRHLECSHQLQRNVEPHSVAGNPNPLCRMLF